MKLQDLTESSGGTHPFLRKLQQMVPDAVIEPGEGGVVIGFTNNCDFPEFQVPSETEPHFTRAGFTRGTDYDWAIAMGDDDPHAVVIKNPAMFDDAKYVQGWLETVAGDPHAMDEEDDE